MILEKAVKNEQLRQFNERFERIKNSHDSDYQKQVDIERLKTDMEFVLCVPLLPDKRYEKENPEVMKLYRQIKREMV